MFNAAAVVLGTCLLVTASPLVLNTRQTFFNEVTTNNTGHLPYGRVLLKASIIPRCSLPHLRLNTSHNIHNTHDNRTRSRFPRQTQHPDEYINKSKHATPAAFRRALQMQVLQTKEPCAQRLPVLPMDPLWKLKGVVHSTLASHSLVCHGADMRPGVPGED